MLLSLSWWQLSILLTDSTSCPTSSRPIVRSTTFDRSRRISIGDALGGGDNRTLIERRFHRASAIASQTDPFHGGLVLLGLLFIPWSERESYANRNPKLRLGPPKARKQSFGQPPPFGR